MMMWFIWNLTTHKAHWISKPINNACFSTIPHIKAEKEENETLCKNDNWILYQLTDKLAFSINLSQKLYGVCIVCKVIMGTSGTVTSLYIEVVYMTQTTGTNFSSCHSGSNKWTISLR